ncbi:MAG: lipid-binding SYLF domain-containing protein [Desulfobulbus sp.]|jgi:lipid-binding SYLF domain-containing protein
MRIQRAGHLLSAIFLLLCLLVFPCGVSIAQPGAYSESAVLVDRALLVYRGFQSNPDMGWFRSYANQARGILIVPQMLRGGFIIGGAGGRGVLLARDPVKGDWSSPAFYSLGSVSIGFQIGADASELILLVMTDKGLNSLLYTDYKLGADVAIAAGPMGGSAKAQTADILAFGRARGVYGGVSLEGAMVRPLHAWNRQYYNQVVQVYDILISQKWHNPQADPLRAVLPGPVRPDPGRPLGR